MLFNNQTSAKSFKMLNVHIVNIKENKRLENGIISVFYISKRENNKLVKS